MAGPRSLFPQLPWSTLEAGQGLHTTYYMGIVIMRGLAGLQAQLLLRGIPDPLEKGYTGMWPACPLRDLQGPREVI